MPKLTVSQDHNNHHQKSSEFYLRLYVAHEFRNYSCLWFNIKTDISPLFIVCGQHTFFVTAERGVIQSHCTLT
jgi:hypothetical protein